MSKTSILPLLKKKSLLPLSKGRIDMYKIDRGWDITPSTEAIFCIVLYIYILTVN